MDVYLPLGNFWAQSARPRVEDDSAFSSGWSHCYPGFLPPAGTRAPTSHLSPPDDPSARLEHQEALWSTILQKPDIHDVAQGVNSYILPTRRNLGQSVSMFLQEIVQHVFFTEGFSHGLHFC